MRSALNFNPWFISEHIEEQLFGFILVDVLNLLVYFIIPHPSFCISQVLLCVATFRYSKLMNENLKKWKQTVGFFISKSNLYVPYKWKNNQYGLMGGYLFLSRPVFIFRLRSRHFFHAFRISFNDPIFSSQSLKHVANFKFETKGTRWKHDEHNKVFEVHVQSWLKIVAHFFASTDIER